VPPTETETAAPTATLDFPTMEATLESTPPVEVTVEATAEITAEATELMTETPTLTPTASETPLPPEPEWVLVSTADFEQGAPPPSWLFVGWEAQTLDGVRAFGLRSFGGSALFAGQALLDTAVQVRVRLSNGIFALGLRQSAADGYTATFEQNGFLRLFRVEQEVGQAFLGPIAGQWRTLRLSAAGDVVRVSLDGAELITFVDTAPLTAGSVTLGGRRSRESRFAVDDLTLWALESEAPASVAAAFSAPMSLIDSQGLGSEPTTVAGRIPSALAYPDTFSGGSGYLSLLAPDGTVTLFSGLTQAAIQPWSRDGQWLLVRAAGDDGFGILNPASGEVRTLTSLAQLGDGTQDECPAWSPDGTQVVFLSRRRDGPQPAPWWGTGSTWYPPALYVVATDGQSAPRRIALSSSQDRLFLGCPQWSSLDNGQRIVALHSGGIVTVNALSGLISAVPNDSIHGPAYYDWDPFVLSPDGTKVAYGMVVAAIDVPSNVSVLDLQTGAVLTAAEEMHDTDYPEWSDWALYRSWNWDPTGTRLAIGRDKSEPSESPYYLYQHDIVIADLAQPCPACTVASVPLSQQLLYSNWIAPSGAGVSWSPDGRWIAAVDPLPFNPQTEEYPLAQVVLLDPICNERLPITGAASWVHTWSGPDLIAWQPLQPTAMRAFSSGGDYCVPVPTPTPTCIGLPVDRTPTNIRSEPGIAGAWLGSFSGDERVRIHGRYTALTSERYDDWYRVETAEGVWGWSAAAGVETTPLYDPLCTQMRIFDTPTSEPRLPLESEILWPPGEYPEAAAFFYQLQSGSARRTDDEFRIPAPFTQFPSSDPIRLTQGYGLTEFAYLFPGTYGGTNQIHSGLDFFGINPSPVPGCTNSEGNPSNSCITVRPVCDGRVVSERGSASETSGDGFTIRCYMQDGSLSNLYVTYNHIQFGTVGSLVGREVRLNTQLGLNVFQYFYQTTDREGNPVTKIVAPHLHLEIFYTRVANNLRLNPLLFFATTIPRIDLFYRPRPTVPDEEQPYDYYPVDGINDMGQTMAFEWAPFDQIDPLDRSNPQVRGYSATRDEYQRQDYDLAIPTADNDEWAVSGDTPGQSSEQPWSRVLTQSGTQNGLQDIQNPMIEWPGQGRLILSLQTVLERMRALTP
jgi:hypothetical protein